MGKIKKGLKTKSSAARCADAVADCEGKIDTMINGLVYVFGECPILTDLRTVREKLLNIRYWVLELGPQTGKRDD